MIWFRMPLCALFSLANKSVHSTDHRPKGVRMTHFCLTVSGVCYIGTFRLCTCSPLFTHYVHMEISERERTWQWFQKSCAILNRLTRPMATGAITKSGGRMRMHKLWASLINLSIGHFASLNSSACVLCMNNKIFIMRMRVDFAGRML